jgi:hypothetical protein
MRWGKPVSNGIAPQFFNWMKNLIHPVVDGEAFEVPGEFSK